MSTPSFPVGTGVISGPLPDIAIQLLFCLKNSPQLFAQSGLTAEQIEQSIQKNLQAALAQAVSSLNNSGPLGPPIAALFTDPLVAVACNGSERETAGIWITDSPFVANAALSKVSILPDATFLAVNVSQPTFQAFINAVWSAIETAGGHLDESGNPGSDGKIQLTMAPQLASPTPNTIQLTVNGNYHNTDTVDFEAGFKLINTQDLYLQAGSLLSWTNNKVEFNNAAFTALQVLGGIVAGALLPDLVATFVEFIQDSLSAAKTNIPSLFNFAQLLSSVVPPVILLTDTNYKLVIQFDSVECDLNPGGSGITVSTQTEPKVQPRDPFVLVRGNLNVVANLFILGEATYYPETYSVLLGDLDSTSAIVWRDSEQEIVANGWDFNAQFDIAGLALGKVRSATYTVTATQATGLSASRSFTVNVSVINQRPVVPTPPRRPVTPILEDR